MFGTSKVHDVFVREISKEVNIDVRVVDCICRHLSRFLAERIRDGEDNRPVRWRYLGVFAMMKGTKKKNVKEL